MPEAIPQDDQPAITAPGSPSHQRRASLKALSRNINKVVLGNLYFDTWYFSPYPETVIFGPDHHPKAHSINGDHGSSHSHKNGHHAEKPTTSIISKLHVCPYCFKYTPNPADYIAHLQVHVRELENDSENWWPVPKTALKVYEWNGYTVWDVDGEQEKLYCQNLSLFAKLFLEQKSVFFDTSGFHYFVLTHAPASAGTPAKIRGRRRRLSGNNADLGLNTQVLGFFSKENLSWDANNLACILVFPPYQHRNLGQLLMAISYKLSGWEWEDSIIGGPEKPLSAMGRKAYVRFWSERVARFFMGMTADAEGEKVFRTVKEKKGKRTTFAREIMTIKEIGDRTGILPEDVIAALSEMGVCVPQKRLKKVKVEEGKDEGGREEDSPTTMLVKRSDVLAWAEAHSVDLVSPVKEEGFLGEWAMSEPEDEDVQSKEDGSGEDREIADSTE
ncbi:SAS complex subunit [Neophaeococcomyces mojaviensis]|uniref:SAS complex subunit n=1 Tax=Neophaeococcomyces mojaviensis TaxID=3383035 RepID=A0ACC3AD28_9EURO|nr:SAS complex subunit [Knufia sp. JES_112]